MYGLFILQWFDISEDCTETVSAEVIAFLMLLNGHWVENTGTLLVRFVHG